MKMPANPLQAPLNIEITTDSGRVDYCEETASATLNALRKDILEGKLHRDAATVIDTRSGGKLQSSKEGTLLKCTLAYPELANLYAPVRHHAAVGMRYGILAGILLHLASLAFVLVRRGSEFGGMLIAIPSFYAAALFLVTRKASILRVLGGILMLPPLLLIFSLSSNAGMLGALIGAVVAGGLLYCMPGMAIGAVVGVIRRRGLPRASDAPQESVTLRVAIPLLIGAALWTAYLLWARGYLMPASR
jgi:hypothetical protein